LAIALFVLLRITASDYTLKALVSSIFTYTFALIVDNGQKKENKGQTMIYKTMHWKLNTEQHEINTNWR
jgi:hypothetical protein